MRVGRDRAECFGFQAHAIDEPVGGSELGPDQLDHYALAEGNLLGLDHLSHRAAVAHLANEAVGGTTERVGHRGGCIGGKLPGGVGGVLSIVHGDLIGAGVDQPLPEIIGTSRAV